MNMCPNFVICDNFIYTESKVCVDCDMLFGSLRGGSGILNFSEEECSICSTVGICITKPKHDHFLCVNCFKECYFGSSYMFKEDEDTLDNYLSFINKCKIHFKHLKEV